MYLTYSLTYVCIKLCIDWNMYLLLSIIEICIYSVFIDLLIIGNYMINYQLLISHIQGTLVMVMVIVATC